MRKFILIAGLVLVSATAQAEPRSLSLAGSDVLATPAPAPVKSDTGKTAEAPQAETTKSDATKSAAPAVEAPKAEAPKADVPKYTERPTVIEPKAAAPKAEVAKADAPKVDQTTTESAKPTKSANSEKRRKRYWTEGRIISELHRHGVYW